MLDVGLLVLVQVDLVEPRPVEPNPLPLANNLGGVDLKRVNESSLVILIRVWAIFDSFVVPIKFHEIYQLSCHQYFRHIRLNDCELMLPIRF